MKKYLAGLAVLAMVCTVAGAEQEVFPVGKFASRDARDAHDSVSGQKKNLLAIQGGYLSQDIDAVAAGVKALNKNMTSMERSLPDESEAAGASVGPFRELAAETKMMQASLDQNDFGGVYDHYISVAAKCARCHDLGAAPVAENTDGAETVSAGDIMNNLSDQGADNTPSVDAGQTANGDNPQ